ncbi:MAG: four helix bundle protein [Melioribacteraceae bacterium]|nr:four helix bundle protein [Melioribacteraceae bacterium]
MKEKIFFDHEKLIVYQRALEVISFFEIIFQKKIGASYKSQLERASSSIPLNIAEGNGKFTSKDRCKYFDIARGSSLECASGLDIQYIKNKISEEELYKGKSLLKEVVSMLVGLIKSNSNYRVYEPSVEYHADGDKREN